MELKQLKMKARQKLKDKARSLEGQCMVQEGIGFMFNVLWSKSKLHHFDLPLLPCLPRQNLRRGRLPPVNTIILTYI